MKVVAFFEVEPQCINQIYDRRSENEETYIARVCKFSGSICKEKYYQCGNYKVNPDRGQLFRRC